VAVMNDKRWQKLQQIFQKTIERRPDLAAAENSASNVVVG
jgi:hypothetical protein